MKRHLFAAALLAALPLAGHAQSAVPGSISYQGKVFDASGTPLGAVNPINREVILRVYDHATSAAPANRLYSEKQTVTIANGEFSILLGLGAPVAGETNAGTLEQVFNGATRFLGVTVDDGNPGIDPEISPRQQIVSTAYAFRAKVAEGVVSQGITSAMLANNAVTAVQLAEGAVTHAKLAAGGITSDKIAPNTITSANILDGTVGTADLANGSLTLSKFASDIGVWRARSGTVYFDGNVRVGGTATPTERLQVTGGNLRLDRENYLGFGPTGNNFTYQGKDMASYGLGYFSDTDWPGSASGWLTAHAAMKFFTNNNFRAIITPEGRFGLGLTHPTSQLHLYSYVSDIPQLHLQSSSNVNSMRIQHAANSQGGLDLSVTGTDAYITNTPGALIMRLGTSTGTTNMFALEPARGVGLNGRNLENNIDVYVHNKKTYGLAIHSYLNNRFEFLFENDGRAWKRGGGGFSNLSDARLKRDIHDLGGSLDRLLRLRPVTFRFNDEAAHGGGVQTGFIAQEVEQVFPEWVSDGPDGWKGVTIQGFEAQAVQALRELRAEKDALAARVATLEAEAAANEKRLADIEKKLAALSAR